jgi:hypothetical protein
VNVTSGVNNVSFDVLLDGSSNNLVSNFIMNTTLTFLVNGSLQFGNNSIQPISKNMTINGLGGLPFSINSTNFVNATGSMLTFQIKGSFMNSCPIIANFTQIYLNITYNGQIIGNASSGLNVNLQPGLNSFTFTAQLNGSSGQLINNFIMNSSLTFLIAAFLQIGASDPPSAYLSLFARNVTLSGMGGIPFAITSINLLNATNSLLTLQINGNFTNACSLNANFSRVFLNFTYGGQWIGNATIQNFSLSPGVNPFTIQAVLNGSNSQLINNFIQNASLNLLLNATMQINWNDPMSSWIPLFSRNITLAGFNGLNPTIQSFSLLNATATQLLLSIQASVINPTTLTSNISRIWVDIWYQGQYLGNASITNTTIIPGTNQMNINATFGGNSSAISQFLGDYISNVSTPLQLQMNITILGININSSMQYQFPVLTHQLVSLAVTIISISPSYPFSYSIDIQVTVNNPMAFPVNVTYFDGTAKYNDIYGVNVPVPMPPWSYSYATANNLTLTQVTFSNWATNPLQLPGAGSNHDIYHFTGTDTEEGARLYNIYYVNHALYINIYQGTVSFQIGCFSSIVNVDLLNIKVP